MHAATVDLLVKKANLEPRVALAFAEAIDMAVKETQWVTVPILDARLGASEARNEAKIDQAASRLDAKIDRVRTELEAKIDRVKVELEAKIEQVKVELEVKIEQVKAELLVQMHQIKAELVRWLFLVVIGNAAIAAVLNAIQRVH